MQQLLRDSNIQPTNEVLSAAIGDSYPAYTKFTDMLSDFGVEPHWQYYNDGKAWLCKGLHKWKTSRGTDKEKTVFWLSVWERFFKVTFFIPEKSRFDLQNICFSENTNNLIADAKTMGKLKFFPLVFNVSSTDLFGDFGTLINFQKSLK